MSEKDDQRDLERGPQGDHGQDGRDGGTGVTGPAGATGAAGPQGAQGTAGKDWKLSGWALGRLLAYVLVAAAAFYASAASFQLNEENRRAIEQIEEQRISSRHQICLSNEREHLQSVNALKATYAYLETLPDDAFTPSAANAINIAVLRSLPEREAEANVDVAPAFCDETRSNGEDIGLPEPDPEVPERPERIDNLLNQLKG